MWRTAASRPSPRRLPSGLRGERAEACEKARVGGRARASARPCPPSRDPAGVPRLRRPWWESRYSSARTSAPAWGPGWGSSPRPSRRGPLGPVTPMGEAASSCPIGSEPSRRSAWLEARASSPRRMEARIAGRAPEGRAGPCDWTRPEPCPGQGRDRRGRADGAAGSDRSSPRPAAPVPRTAGAVSAREVGLVASHALPSGQAEGACRSPRERSREREVSRLEPRARRTSQRAGERVEAAARAAA